MEKISSALDTLTRFEKLVDISKYSTRDMKDIRFLALCANFNHNSKEKAFLKFSEMMKREFNLDLEKLAKEKGIDLFSGS